MPRCARGPGRPGELPQTLDHRGRHKLLDDPCAPYASRPPACSARFPTKGLAQDRVPAFRTAYDELLKYLHYQADLSTGALMLADHYTRVGELDQAEHHHRRTLKMDRQANYARLQLARLYNAQGRNPGPGRAR